MQEVVRLEQCVGACCGGDTVCVCEGNFAMTPLQKASVTTVSFMLVVICGFGVCVCTFFACNRYSNNGRVPGDEANVRDVRPVAGEDVAIDIRQANTQGSVQVLLATYEANVRDVRPVAGEDVAIDIRQANTQGSVQVLLAT